MAYYEIKYLWCYILVFTIDIFTIEDDDRYALVVLTAIEKNNYLYRQRLKQIRPYQNTLKFIRILAKKIDVNVDEKKKKTLKAGLIKIETTDSNKKK